MGSFALDMSKFAKKAGSNNIKVIKVTSFSMFSAMQRGTPVDTANARFSWFIDMNSFSNKVVDNKSGEASDSATSAEMDAKILSGLGKYKLGDTITFVNNSDHIIPLEYGLFPWANSAKVINHFSAQAPAGFFRINVMKFQTFVNQAKDYK